MKQIINYSLIFLMGIAIAGCQKHKTRWSKIVINKEERNITLSSDEHAFSILTIDDRSWSPVVIFLGDRNDLADYSWMDAKQGATKYDQEFDGGWFKIGRKNLSSLQITLSKNETDTVRILKIPLRGVYCSDEIKITQKAKAN